MKHYDNSEIINIGCGHDQTIKALALAVKKIVGYVGTIRWDSTKPNGIPRKKLDVDKLFTLGWRPKVSLEDGIQREYNWFLAHEDEILQKGRAITRDIP